MVTTTTQAEFQKLMDADPNGMLRPEAIVEVAKNPTHPFHSWFTWDDTEAAKKWRYEEAGQLIKSYRIFIEPLNIRVRGLTSLESDRQSGGGYRFTMDVLARPNMRNEMLTTALRELEAMEKRYNHLQDLDRVWKVAHTVKAKAVKATKAPALKVKAATV